MARTIALVTTGRSDHGHLSPLMQALQALPDVAPKWIETLSCRPFFGHTVETPYDVINDMKGELVVMGSQLNHDRPDILVVFGDRWEQFAAATAAHILGIPIVHLHAGETTEAVYDDGFRAAISALATHHVAAAEPYAERLRQQGYRSVHCLGAPGLGRLSEYRWHNLEPYPLILVQFHPETRNLADIPRQVEELWAALEQFDPLGIIVTEPGMDAGRQHIIDGLKRWPFRVFTDAGWLEMLGRADVLVGNSSCGIIETPSIPLPSVNIGERQRGRLRASSVINAPHNRVSIETAIRYALNPEWRKEALTGDNPYGDRGAAQRIAEFLRAL